MNQPINTTITEGDFAHALGISKEALKKMRRDLLTREQDWILGEKSRCIEYSIFAIKKIRAALGLPEPLYLTWPGGPPFEPGPDLAQKKKGAGPVNLRVLKVYGNRIVMLCVQMDAPRAEVRLKVRDNSNFMPGMIVPGIHVEADRYDYAGRLPRRKGRI